MPRRKVSIGVRAASTSLSGQTQAGLCLPFTGRESDVPEGWLICGGQAVSRTTYLNLFRYYELLGFPYGNGDGVNTFNVPDMRGRQVFGKDNMGGVPAGRVTLAGSGIAGDTIAAAGGSQNHVLTSTQSVRHNHGGATGSFNLDHTHNYDTFSCNFGREGGGDHRSSIIGGWGGTTTYSNMVHAHSIGAIGGGAAHNNMNNTIVLCWIVKV